MSKHERWGTLCYFCEESWPCETVTLRDENARLREQREALAEALAEVFRETEHINTRRGSRNGRIREVVEAALRAYREGRDE